MKRLLLLAVLVSLPSTVLGQDPGPPGVRPNIPDGYTIIEGDILVPEGYQRGTLTAQLWPGGRVPYEFNGNVSTSNRQAMLAAMDEWEAVADVRFVPRNGEDDYVHIQDDTANYSAVGRQDGRQVIGIFNWNFRFIMAHELAHALGFFHEQSRSDRDNYVSVNPAAIVDTMEFNFDIQPSTLAYPKQSYGLPDTLTYDFDSVMHYGQFTFCIDPCPGPTITVLPPNGEWQARIGQRTRLSFLDRVTMRQLYLSNGVIVDGTAGSFFNIGTLLAPYQTFGVGYARAPTGGSVLIQPGSYSAAGLYTKQAMLEAPLGEVVLR
ncbi:MAG: M12 family metallopeptidase [Bacteroidota bacterium]